MHFVDEVTLTVISGAGGDGCVSWRKEAHVPRGGPAGGDGGPGGDVVLAANDNVHTLLDLRYRKLLKAKRGVNGQGQQKTGARGEDRVVVVPVGTLAHDHDTGELLGDLTASGERLVIAAGGHGGKGNARFRSATNRTPENSTEGGPAQTRTLRLELKLLADVGLVGLPNAGKSTLISRLSAAKPRVADYPFTTLVPNLGVVEVGNFSTFVMADVPGLIEGAHKGAGLGHRFLRHIERTGVLVYLVDHAPEQGRDAVESLATLRRELELYDETLTARLAVVVLNKLDLPDSRVESEAVARAAAELDLPFLCISAVTGEGLKDLVQELARQVDESRRLR
jgi:GTP-binding protein